MSIGPPPSLFVMTVVTPCMRYGEVRAAFCAFERSPPVCVCGSMNPGATTSPSRRSFSSRSRDSPPRRRRTTMRSPRMPTSAVRGGAAAAVDDRAAANQNVDALLRRGRTPATIAAQRQRRCQRDISSHESMVACSNDGRILRAARGVVLDFRRAAACVLPRRLTSRMRFGDVLLTAITQIRANKLRSFFTLLGIIVSVAFLVAVVAVIQGMNAYVKENIADAMIGSNTFQVRRTPINIALIRGRRLAADAAPQEDHAGRRRRRAQPRCPTRQAIGDDVRISRRRAATSCGRDKTLGDVLVFGVTPVSGDSGLSIRVRRAADARSTSASGGSSSSSARTSPTSCSTDAIPSARAFTCTAFR